MKNRLSKSFALTTRNVTTKDEFRELVEEELQKMAIAYDTNEIIHAIVPEL